MVRPLLARALLASVFAGVAAPPVSALPPQSQTNAIIADPLQRLLDGHTIVYGHLISGAKAGSSVDARTSLGTVAPLPAVRSARFQRELQSASASFDAGRFADAAATMRPAYDSEPQNPFVLNEYARALFRIDSMHAASRSVYEKLIALIARQQHAAPGVLVVDLWFSDADWKLALLYLDANDYKHAVVEFAKASFSPNDNPQFREQLNMYMADSFYHLGDQAGADWFIQKTLAINPRNQYVLPFRKPPGRGRATSATSAR